MSKAKKLLEQGQQNADALESLHGASEAAKDKKTKKSLENQLDTIGEQLKVKGLDKKLDSIEKERKRIEKETDPAKKLQRQEALQKKQDALHAKLAKNYKKLSEPDRAVVDSYLGTAVDTANNDKGSSKVAQQATSKLTHAAKVKAAEKLTSSLKNAVASKAVGLSK